MPATTTSPRLRNPDYRPASCWKNDDPLAEILQNVTGTRRRRVIAKAWENGTLDELPDALLQDQLDPDTRAIIGRAHPSLMGGEDLPAYLPDDVEILRIHIPSTTSDVVSLRARRETGDPRIHYRFVDEYPWNTFRIARETSEHPLTTAELIHLIDHSSDEYGTGFGTCYTEYNYQDHPEADSYHGFTVLSSKFCAEVCDYYEQVHEQRLDEWLAEEREAKEEDDDD